MDEAARWGFVNGDPDWENLGQGEPEVDALIGGSARIKTFQIESDDNRYGPTNGIDDLRETISAHYNRLYRRGCASQYTARNVSLAMGGRLALSRIFAMLDKIRFGYKTPEYPAYAEMMAAHAAQITPVCLPTRPADNHVLPAAEFALAIQKEALKAFLFSNPCNPTGHVIQGEELKAYVQISQTHHCALIIDEFYSHYIYTQDHPAAGPVSAAACLQDVNADVVLIVDGLTKSFRYPGWRLAWVLGPENLIADLGRVASYLDGGPSVPVQRAALQLFEPERMDRESQALRTVFSRKQHLMRESLRQNGMICSPDAHGTFYVWADISQLPAPLNQASVFFQAALRRKVIVVPGYLFDIRPQAQERDFQQSVRFSFGPTEANIRMGLERVTELVQAYS